jgi:hypothetical protein
MYDKLALATALFVLGQIITWFSSYSQFVWQWAADRPVVIAAITAIPAALCFIYGLKYAYSFFDSGWGPRFYIFSLSFIVMPVLFWYFMNESFFTIKNMASVFLATIIIFIQMRFK